MLFAAALVPLLAVSVAAVEKRDLNPGEIEGLVANFQNAGLLDALGGADAFKPQGLLTGKFGDADWTVGANFTQNQTTNFPSFFVNPTNGSTAFANETSLFTAILMDAGVVGSNSTNATLHWLINTIHVNTTGGAPFALNYDNGTTITEYAGPAPPAGSGPHRYVLGLFSQDNATFTAPAGFDQRNTPVGPIDFQKYITDSKLGSLVAANYFTVSNGETNPSVSLSQTQPVESSTLPGFTGAAPVATAAGANGGGSSGNGTDGSGNGSASGSGAAASSSAAGGAGSGASALTVAPVVVGLLGMVAGAATLF